MKYYIAYIVGCTDPELRGPFLDSDQRDEAAITLRKDEASDEDGIFPLAVNDKGIPSMGSYSSGFMENGVSRIKIVELMHQAKLDASDLDELVDETVSCCGSETPASNINNGGIVEQLDYILNSGVEEYDVLMHLGLLGSKV